MHQLRLFSAPLALLLLGTACSPLSPEPEESGFIGTWAGESWSGDSYATLSPRGDSIYVGGSAPVGAGMMAESSVSFVIPFSGGGEHEIPAGDAYFHYLIGGDVLRASYASTAEAPGRVTFEFISPTRVRGTITFLGRSTDADAPVGPSARFEGTFDAELGGATPLW